MKDDTKVASEVGFGLVETRTARKKKLIALEVGIENRLHLLAGRGSRGPERQSVP